jgi:hypothetical protein
MALRLPAKVRACRRAYLELAKGPALAAGGRAAVKRDVGSAAPTDGGDGLASPSDHVPSAFNGSFRRIARAAVSFRFRSKSSTS